MSDEESIAAISEIFAEELDGHEIFANNSKWINFTTVRNENWRHRNLALLGDAAHTAHFSIGSGTKLAMEDSLALAACLHEHPSVDEALAAYEAERRPVVASTQRAAQASLEWFENIGQYADQDALRVQFQSAHAQPPNHPRESGPARSRVRRAGVHGLRRAVGQSAEGTRDVPAAPDRAARAPEPYRRLPHGHVLRRRRPARGLSPDAPRQQGGGWRRPRHDRNGVRLGERAHHAGVHRTLR